MNLWKMMTTMIKLSNLFLLAVLLFAANSLSAANKRTEDRKIWGEFGVKYAIDKDWTISLSQEMRYYKERKVLEQSLSDIGASYKFTNWFRMGLFYRYKAYPDVKKRTKDKYAHETHLNFYFKYNYAGFELSDRVRLQARFKVKEDDKFFLRNRIEAEYKELAAWARPFASAELFYLLGGDSEIKKGRYALGVNFIPVKKHEISLYFMRENEYNQKKIENANIIGVSYQLKL